MNLRALLLLLSLVIVGCRTDVSSKLDVSQIRRGGIVKVEVSLTGEPCDVKKFKKTENFDGCVKNSDGQMIGVWEYKFKVISIVDVKEIAANQYGVVVSNTGSIIVYIQKSISKKLSMSSNDTVVKLEVDNNTDSTVSFVSTAGVEGQRTFFIPPYKSKSITIANIEVIHLLESGVMPIGTIQKFKKESFNLN